jgi:hypothetical protein
MMDILILAVSTQQLAVSIQPWNIFERCASPHRREHSATQPQPKPFTAEDAERRGGAEKTKNWVVDCPENLRKKRRFLEIAVQRTKSEIRPQL